MSMQTYALVSLADQARYFSNVCGLSTSGVENIAKHLVMPW